MVEDVHVGAIAEELSGSHRCGAQAERNHPHRRARVLLGRVRRVQDERGKHDQCRRQLPPILGCWATAVR